MRLVGGISICPGSRHLAFLMEKGNNSAWTLGLVCLVQLGAAAGENAEW